MVPPPPSAHLLLLAVLAGFLGPREVVVTVPVKEAGARCPEGLWPLPPQVLPRVTYTQAPALAFALRSWRPPGAEASRGPRRSPGGAKKRGLRAVFEVQPTPSGLRGPSASPSSLKAQQSILGTLGEGDNASSMPSVPLLPGGLGKNTSSKTGTQIPKGHGSSQGCTCPSQASKAPQAAGPPRVARGPTPRTEEAAWAAMALTFLLVLLTLATLCTRLHRNFRRSESIYWGSTADSQDTVAAVLKRRLLLAPRRVKRSRRRPLLPPAPDSGPDGESSD